MAEKTQFPEMPARRQRDLTDFVLALMALGLIIGFCIFALPSIIAIYGGTYRVMSLPDGSRITFTNDVQGMVGLAQHAGGIEVTGWAFDRRIPDRNIRIEIFASGRRVAIGITDREEEDIGRAAGLHVATPRFVIHFPDDLAPADPNEPLHVFAIGQREEGRELFKGGRPVRIVEEPAPKTMK